MLQCQGDLQCHRAATTVPHIIRAMFTDEEINTGFFFNSVPVSIISLYNDPNIENPSSSTYLHPALQLPTDHDLIFLTTLCISSAAAYEVSISLTHSSGMLCLFEPPFNITEDYVKSVHHPTNTPRVSPTGWTISTHHPFANRNLDSF